MAIQFKLNKQKAIEAVLWLIQRGESDMYRIWKMLFAAEKYHLNKYGRPITGDAYMAMKYGTVPNWLYNEAMEQLGLGLIRYENTLFGERSPIRKLFSESDIEALERGYNEYVGLNFEEVKTKNHKEPAWEKNWGKRGVLEKVVIPFEDLIDETWLKEELELTSIYTVI
jgi:uncharacterized phage-associated protein